MFEKRNLLFCDGGPYRYFTHSFYFFLQIFSSFAFSWACAGRDPATGENLFTFKGHNEPVYAVQSDSNVVISG
jgi:hypothetical protein